MKIIRHKRKSEIRRGPDLDRGWELTRYRKMQ